MPEPRRTFVPVLGAGLAAAALVTYAGTRPWVAYRSLPASSDPLGRVAEAGKMPLAVGLGLVLLACWGVALVTRGRLRRAVLALGLLSALGVVASVVVGESILAEQVAEAELFGPTGTTDADPFVTTAWFWADAVAGVSSVVTTALAVLWCPAWPEMGSRYDAPGSAGAAVDDVPPQERSNLDLWKQLDEGRDPTA